MPSPPPSPPTLTSHWSLTMARRFHHAENMAHLFFLNFWYLYDKSQICSIFGNNILVLVPIQNINIEYKNTKCINFMSCKVGAHKSLLSMASVQWQLLLQLCPDAEVRTLDLIIKFLKKSEIKIQKSSN